MTAGMAALAHVYMDIPSLEFWVLEALGQHGVVRLGSYVVQSATRVDP